MSELVQDREQRAAATWRDDWPVAVAAASAAGAVWAIATVAGVDLEVRSGSGTRAIGLVSVIVTALVVAMAGAGLLRLLERRTTRARSIWTAVAGAVWVASLAGPAGAASLTAGLTLLTLHVVVGAVVIIGLRRRSAVRTGRPPVGRVA